MFSFLQSLFTASTVPDEVSSEDGVDAKKVSEHSKEAPVTELRGALYLIDGLKFDCLMSECEIDLDGRLLVFTPKDSSSSRLYVMVERLRLFRQHLVDGFQFLSKKTISAEEVEYGVQLESVSMALSFRQEIFTALIDTAVTLVEVECAVAEYKTKEREFHLQSTTAKVKLMQRPSDSEAFFVVYPPSSITNNDLSSEGTEADSSMPLVVETLSKEMQLWPSPSTNQLTFWAIPFDKAGVEKVMWLLEMNVEHVGETIIKKFFYTLASILHDDTLIDSEKKETETDITFDLGDLGDPTYKRTWAHSKVAASSDGENSTNKLALVSTEAAEEESSDEEEESVPITMMEDTRPSYFIDPKYSSSSSELTHRFMEVGADRTFVCRGDPNISKFNCRSREGKRVVSVYKRSNDDETLQSVGTISTDKFKYRNEKFAPDKGLLHQQETKLLVVPEADVNGDVYLMDLTTEKVVQKWDAGGTSIQTLFPTFKRGQASHDPTFLCANPRNLFMMDTRMKGEAKTTGISYLTDPRFTVGTTDEEGHILMGSRTGELRLYDGEQNNAGNFKRAKTLLQTIKEPITAVDVTKDGAWIVATTKTFLVVFCTRLAGSGKTGFQTALGQAKPQPRFLMLKAEDVVKYSITDIDFAPAKFDAEEDCIVTSTGNMAVVWDFGMVKRGNSFYSIRFANDAIRDVQIASDSADVVVVSGAYSRPYKRSSASVTDYHLMQKAEQSADNTGTQFDWNKLPPALQVVYDKQGHRQEVIDGATFWNFLTQCTVAKEGQVLASSYGLPLGGDSSGDEDLNDEELEEVPQARGRLSDELPPQVHEQFSAFLQAIITGAEKGQPRPSQGEGQSTSSWSAEGPSEVAIRVGGEDEWEDASMASEDAPFLVHDSDEEEQRPRVGSSRKGTEIGEAMARAFGAKFQEMVTQVPPEIMMQAQQMALNALQGGAGNDPMFASVMQMLASAQGEGGIDPQQLLGTMAQLLGGGMGEAEQDYRTTKLKELIQERRADPERQHVADMWERVVEASNKAEVIANRANQKLPFLQRIIIKVLAWRAGL